MQRILLIAFVLAGNPLAHSADEGGGSFSVGLSFKNLGTQVETTEEAGGITLIYPEDEADTMALLRPALLDFRKRRAARAKAEARELREVFADAESKEKILVHVGRLLGKESLSPDAGAAYDGTLREIEVLFANWERWSGDIGTFHLYNHATVAPFRKGENTIEFDEIHLTHQKQTGSYNVTLDPPITRRGAGIGVIISDPATVSPMKLEMFNSALPGTPVETVAADLKRFVETFADLLERNAIQTAVSVAQQHQIETLLRHELRAGTFSPGTPDTITNGVARYYLMVHEILSSKGDPDLQGSLARLVYFPPPSDSDEANAMFNRLAEGPVLPDKEIDAELTEPAARLLAWSLLTLGQNSDTTTPLLGHFLKSGIPVPEAGFDRDRFAAALETSYPEVRSRMEDARAKMIEKMRSELVAPLTEPETKEPAKPAPLPNRSTIVVDGYTFHYPDGLEKAVASLAPEWAAGLRAAHKQLRIHLPSREDLVPTIALDEPSLDSIRALGLHVYRDMADHAAALTSLTANLLHFAIPAFLGSEIQIHHHGTLREQLRAGAAIEGFSLDGPEEKVSFEFQVSLFDDLTKENFEKAAEALPPIVFPVVAKLDDDFSATPLEDQIEALRVGASLLEDFAKSAKEDKVEELLQQPLTWITEPQSRFIVIHEVVEAALVRQVIASADRRWFCDGFANLVAIRECDRFYGPGEGRKIFESLFSPESSRDLADQIDLLAWSAGETPSPLAGADGLTSAHYFFATDALVKATAKRDPEFLSQWIAKIRETRWNRTNAGSVIAAYLSLTGEDLMEYLKISKPVQ